MLILTVFDAIGKFIAENKTVLSITTIVTGLGSGFIYFVVKKVIPSAIEEFLGFLTKVVTKLFGGTVEGISEEVQPVPALAKMDEWTAQLTQQKVELQFQSELKLIELKNKLVSSKLTTVERIAYQALYDKIMLDYGNRISQSTLTTLAAIEQAAREKAV